MNGYKECLGLGIGYLGIPKQSKIILVNPLILLRLLKNKGNKDGGISKSQYRKAVRYGKTTTETRYKILSLIRSKTRINNKQKSKRVKSKPSTFLLLNGYKLIINDNTLSKILDRVTPDELQNIFKPLIDYVIKSDLLLLSGNKKLELPPNNNEKKGGEN